MAIENYKVSYKTYRNEKLKPVLFQGRETSIQTVIALGRGHNIVPIVAIQDYSQLKKVYSNEETVSIDVSLLW